MTEHKDGVPVLQDEVNRKAFTTMEWLFSALNSGNMTARQFSTGVNALFMATSGLVDDGMMALMGEASAVADDTPETFKVCLLNGAVTVSLEWCAGVDGFKLVQRANGVVTASRQISAASPNESLQKMRTLAAKLTSSGFQEL